MNPAVVVDYKDIVCAAIGLAGFAAIGVVYAVRWAWVSVSRWIYGR
jgi:hypothetical protein